MIIELKSKETIKIIVKTNSNKTELIGFDKEKKAYILRIKSMPEKGKANEEIIRFFSKYLKKRVKIIKGLKSREKILKVI